MAPFKKKGPKKLSSKKKVLKNNGLKKRSFKKKAAVFENRRGAVFFSNLPHGYYERALDRYLEQFGEINRIKVARSLKNAKPLGYAYVEFKHEKVALIVAKTMNNYLMFKKLLKCKFIKHEHLNNKMWANSSITPELCTGTIQKRRNQYLLETRSAEGYEEKKIQKEKKMKNYLKNTLGLKLYNIQVDDDKENMLIRMVFDDNDDEISIKTPPNVIKVKKNKNSSNSVRPVICDGDATTVKKVIKKRRSSSLDLVTKELFNKNLNCGNNSKKLKQNSDNELSLKVGKEKKIKKNQIMLQTKNISKSYVNSMKHDANLSKTERLSNAKLIDKINKKAVSTPEDKTQIKKKLTDKSLKKVINDKVSCSTSEESLAPKKSNIKRKRRPRGSRLENKEEADTPSQTMYERNKITLLSDDVQINNVEMSSQNKTPKSSKVGCKVVIGNVSANQSPVKESTNVIKKQNKGTPKSSSLPIKSNVNTPSQKLSKKAKVMPTTDNIKISGLAKTLKSGTPKFPKIGDKGGLGKISSTPSSLIKNCKVNKKMPLSPKMDLSAQKVILSEKKERLGSKDKQRFDNSTIQRATSQRIINRRASLGVKKAAIVKTPKTNRVRSQQKIHLPVSL